MGKQIQLEVVFKTQKHWKKRDWIEKIQKLDLIKL